MPNKHSMLINSTLTTPTFYFRYWFIREEPTEGTTTLIYSMELIGIALMITTSEKLRDSKYASTDILMKKLATGQTHTSYSIEKRSSLKTS